MNARDPQSPRRDAWRKPMFYELLSCGGVACCDPHPQKNRNQKFQLALGRRTPRCKHCERSQLIVWGSLGDGGTPTRSLYWGLCLFFVFLGENTRSSSCVVSDFPTSQHQIAPQLTLALEFGGRAPEVLGTSLKLRGREIGKDVIGRSCDFMKATKKKRARVHNACNSVSEGTVWI